MNVLDAGNAFPKLTVAELQGGMLTLGTPRGDHDWQLVVVYRGLHCPICKQYLSKMRELYDEFLSKGIETIHVSMDSEERARQAHEDWSLDPIPMGYGLTEEQARDWGLYLSEPIQDSEKGTFAEPAVFWVRPDGRLYLANISSAPFARPDLEALLGRVDMIKEKEYPARGRKAA